MHQLLQSMLIERQEVAGPCVFGNFNIFVTIQHLLSQLPILLPIVFVLVIVLEFDILQELVIFQ